MDILYSALTQFFSGVPRPVVLHEPWFCGNENKYVKDCVDTGWVSSVGAYVERFERDLSEYTNAFAVPVMNGTAALHLALILAGVKPGDEVLVPDLTFVASANAVHYCHAIPHFVEVDEKTFAVDPAKLDVYLADLSDVPKFLMVAHIFGHPAAMLELQEVCQKYNITLIEDAAESLGTWVGEKHTGTFGKVAALSFNGNKIMTTGGGGAVITCDPELAALAKHLSTTARISHPYSHHHDDVGYNYRMPNINAALGCAQLEKLPFFLEQKRILAASYKKLFSGFEDIWFIEAPIKEGVRCNYWLNNILLPSQSARDALIDAMANDGVFCRGLWAPMSSLPMYRKCPRMDTAIAYDLCSRVVSLPSSASLTQYVSVS